MQSVVRVSTRKEDRGQFVCLSALEIDNCDQTPRPVEWGQLRFRVGQKWGIFEEKKKKRIGWVLESRQTMIFGRWGAIQAKSTGSIEDGFKLVRVYI